MSSIALSYHSQAPDRVQTGRYALLALLCAAAAIAYVQRNAIAVPQGLMEADLRLDKVRFGAVMSMWMLGYAAGQIPCGWLGDRWGERNTLTLYAMLWSVATGLVAVT
ncbi:MAG TPA: MFS transporter, partial [Humisphaera sp.]|nr:MFS transporter [Humisphaera sp.]